MQDPSLSVAASVLHQKGPGTVEKTVKPLKSGENVVTSEHNNGPQKRSGGDRERKYHLEQAKLK